MPAPPLARAPRVVVGAGEPRGVMYFEYSTEEEAATAKDKMNGRLCMGRPLVVRLVDEQVDQDTLLGAGATADVDDLAQKTLAEKRKEMGSGVRPPAKPKSQQIALLRAKLDALAAEDEQAKKAAENRRRYFRSREPSRHHRMGQGKPERGRQFNRCPTRINRGICAP